MRHRLLYIVLLSAAISGILLARSPQSEAQTSDRDSGQPDQAVLTPAPAALPPGPGLTATTSMYLSPPTEAAHPFTHAGAP